MEYPTYNMCLPRKVISGIGSIKKLQDIITENGAGCIVLISDPGVIKAGLAEQPKQLLENMGLEVHVLSGIPPEPTVEQVLQLNMEAASLKPDLLVAVGGGSVIDTTKLLSVLYTNPLLRVNLTDSSCITNKGVPTVMIPTTAGTGAEATPNAIVMVPEMQTKVGIVSNKMIADYVILDAGVTAGLPPAITAATGLDAFSHALECFISKKANPFSDMFALEAMRLIWGSIRRAYSNGNDMTARHNMLLGAYYGGTCIASSSTAAVHALAYPLAGRYHMPHGLSIAVLLSDVMEYNIPACVDKFSLIASVCGIGEAPTDFDRASLFIREISLMCTDLGIPRSIASYGVTRQAVPEIAETALGIRRLLDNNPLELGKEDIMAIYNKLL